MSPVPTWNELFVDRLPYTPAAERMLLSGSPLKIDGQKHIVGRRMAEVCALFGRHLKTGTHLAAFTTPQDVEDLMTVGAYLHDVWSAIIEGTSSQGSWAKISLEYCPNLWMITSVPRMRDLWCDRLTLADRPMIDTVACGWRAGPSSAVPLVRSGGASLPLLGVFGADAVMQGALATIGEKNAAPFAVIIDSFGLNKSYDLAELIENVLDRCCEAPIFMLGSIGDTAAIQAARNAKFSTWVLRAGDIARLDQTETEQRITLGTMYQMRNGGADQAAQRLSAGIHVDISVLISSSANRLFMPLLNALQQLELKAQDSGELLKRARRFARAALSFSVPWKIHMEAIANGRSVGRFATPSVLDLLAALRESATASGEIARAAERVVDCGQQIIDVISAPTCVTSKETALLEAAQAAQSNEKPLRIICANQTAQRAAQRYLSEHEIDTLKGCVKVDTRSQLRRAVSAGTHDGADLLLLDPIGFSDGWYFSGLSSRIHLLSYALEREGIERQLKLIGFQTQCASALIDKRLIVTGSTSITLDKEVDATPPRWQVNINEKEIPGLWPGKLPSLESIESFVLSHGEWMQKAMESDNDDDEGDSIFEPNDTRSSAIGPHVHVLLDTQKRAIALSPYSKVLILPKAGSGQEPGSIFAREIQVGQQLLIARRNNNGDLLDRILDRCVLSAELEVARELRSIWLDALAELERIAEENHIDVLELLKRHGVLVTTNETVQNWIRGNTICPRDLESIIAVGEATQRPELIHNAKVFFGALTHMRRVSIAITTKAVEYNKAGAALGPDEIIDPALRLRRSDLLNFSCTGRVVAVETIAQAA